MNRRAGFTLVELLITITIMVILMTLVVFNLRSVQVNARDEKRATDAEVIARGLEIRYANGNPRATSAYINKSEYPGINEMFHALGFTKAGFVPTSVSGGYLQELLPGTEKILGTGSNLDFMCASACAAEVAATVNSMTTISKYVYEPIDSSNNVCFNGGCIRFNLYYRTEKDNVVRKIMSKHQ
ncbi:MAG TPA: type II secretion system protein [Candidatus Saccharimonadales bacterium]|nr:type II secretion system protein [Candidatus Saccharimonadales bacterium]